MKTNPYSIIYTLNFRRPLIDKYVDKMDGFITFPIHFQRFVQVVGTYLSIIYTEYSIVYTVALLHLKLIISTVQGEDIMS